jgi:hypothetical protein
MKTAILHYSVPPVVGGVEAVILAHTSLLLEAGYPVTLVAGIGEKAALPHGAEYIQIVEMDSRNPRVVEISRQLEAGNLPADFEALSSELENSLERVVHQPTLAFQCTSWLPMGPAAYVPRGYYLRYRFPSPPGRAGRIIQVPYRAYSCDQ